VQKEGNEGNYVNLQLLSPMLQTCFFFKLYFVNVGHFNVKKINKVLMSRWIVVVWQPEGVQEH
jgi:hypothetical protein